MGETESFDEESVDVVHEGDVGAEGEHAEEHHDPEGAREDLDV